MSDQLEIHMESALTPREIQARIRNGANITEVAQAAGVPAEKIEPYAVPVLAEREYQATQARGCAVRRGADTVSGNLEDVVATRLADRGIPRDALHWDSWRDESRAWTVQVSYESGKANHQALFSFDPKGRFSVARNDEARWLLGLRSAAHGPQPGRRRADEKTVELNPDLTLIRAVQTPTEIDEPENEPSVVIVDEAADDAYTEGVLEEHNGVYDYELRPDSDIDVLYDMLSGLDEDSVKIYTGLLAQANPEAVQSVAPDFLPPEPEQPSLVEEAEPEKPKPAKKARRKRAKVPSWDEIVFGSSRKKD
jgi:hypothetical protein